MAQSSLDRLNQLGKKFLLVVLAIATVVACVGQKNDRRPEVGEGSLLYRSPVSGRYEAVPLLHTDVKLSVQGLMADGVVTQQYANSSTQPIEAVYIFPLPHDAAVYDMEIRIGNRVIRSVIRERAEAKKVYEAAKSAGKHAALVEEERPNIFTTSVANIMPGDHVDVRLRYVEPLRWDAGKMRLVFPMVVGTRYIPGTQANGHIGTGWSFDTNAVADASRITPLIRNPESRSGHDISLQVDLDTGFNAAPVKSVSHQINTSRMPNGHQQVELASGATLPNKDFILEVQQAESKQPTTALFLSPAGDSGETHFLLATYPPTVQPRERMPVEMLYMIDVSGSMEGTSIQQARGALLQALDRLGAGDRFGILAFSSGFQEFAQEPLPATAENLAAARRYVEGLQAGGGTEMLPALQHLMSKPEIPGYLRHIILLTDGDLGNEEEIFSAMRGNLGNARLFTVAIGSAPNLFLATKMAQFGRGTFTHIADISEIQEQMGRLLESIDSAVLTDVKLTFSGVEVQDVYPARLPDLFIRQPLLIFGRITKGQKGTIHLTAREGSEPYEASIAVDASQAAFHPAITTLWARQRVEDLMDHWRHSDQKGQDEIRASIVAHAIRYRLLTRFTSLVAVEEVVVNTSGQSNTAPVPTELPAGWQLEKVVGAPATGTADDFLEAMGIALLLTGLALLAVMGKRKVGAL
ncbi:MAG TPA: marine proteobacterial sortase target protein [Terriglobales bacterium]|nr:marine proteobacterial sortase target protein [Terriglobales bacterium]